MSLDHLEFEKPIAELEEKITELQRISGSRDLNLEDDIELVEDVEDEDTGSLTAESQNAPVVKLVNSLLQHAVTERASDVHLEPFEGEIRVRFRIDMRRCRSMHDPSLMAAISMLLPLRVP